MAAPGAARGGGATEHWEPAWSSTHHRWFYQDRKNGASSWTRPPGCTIQLPTTPPANSRGEAAAATEDLPPGWEAEFDPKHEMYYYFNRTTRERVWKKPGLGSVRQGAAAVSSPVERVGAAASSASGATSSAGFGGAAGVQGRRLNQPTPMPGAMVPTPPSPQDPTALPRRGEAYAGAIGSWDPTAFLDKLARAKATGVQDNVKAVRKEVAEHNYDIRHRWPVPRTVYVSARSCLEGRAPRPFTSEPVVSFSQATTADAVQLLAFGPSKPKLCALNFANGVRVGGGYKNGALAQEEDLCRRMPALFTSLFNARRDGYYPFGPSTCSSPSRPEKYSDVLWTPSVAVGRAAEADGFALLPPERQATVSLVAAAAPNINFANPKDVKDLALMYDTVKTIFLCPRTFEPEISVLVLGAWGCGAFGCNPHEVSDLFCRALAEDGLGRLYKEVHFAIPKSGPEDKHADIFRDALRRRGIAVREVDAGSGR